MALVLKDRVVESSTSSGTGTFTLNGAETGYQSFSVIGNGNTTYYTIEHPQTGEWEVGVGTYNSGTLSRDTVLDSSNGGALVYFSSGPKNVFCDYPASKSVNQNADNKVIIPYTPGVTNVGSLNVGNATSHTDSGVIAAFTASEPLYLYTSLQNTSSANTSYASYAVNDGGHTSYGELGINNSNYSYTAAGYPNNTFSAPLATFVESYGGPLAIGTWDSQKISFIVNGSVNTIDAMTISAAGVVSLNTALGVTSGGTGTTTSTGTGSVVLSDSPTFTTKITTPSVTAPTTDLTLSAISTGAVNLSTATSTFKFIDDTPSPLVSDVRITGAKAGLGRVRFGTQQALWFSTGDFYSFRTSGSPTADGLEQVRISNTASAVNYVQVTGSATTKAPIVSMQGSDTNISMAFQPKGTGAIDLAAGSSGVNISNGGTVTAITRTAAGSSYTSAPTWSASAPTTAGGVTATGTTYLALQALPTITSGGTGYTVGDTLTFVGGSGITTATTLTVSAVSSGVITAVTISANGAYATPPTSPISVTGGTGTGATFTTTSWGLASTIVIGTAGSGYIEQPTVTFSGGGGSGAAAYARVGNPVIFKSLGASLDLHAENGVGFRVLTSSSTAGDVWQALSSGTSAILRSSNATLGANIQTGGTGSLIFGTNNGIQQFNVSHTASAVNYVQVTGSATSGQPNISAQGSDGNIGLNLKSKGTFNVILQNGAGNSGLVVNMTSGTTLANYVEVAPKIAGTSPTISVLGTDTDIDLSLTPKNAGRVRFGTYTGTILTPTGYIEVKDSGGTVRRLLVG